VTHLEKHNRPFRIAIDAAIWNFQTLHGGVGGKNPQLRTLFYRLIKLLALPIDPVFVFDGKNKPLSKRGRTVRIVVPVRDFQYGIVAYLRIPAEYLKGRPLEWRQHFKPGFEKTDLLVFLSVSRCGW
jgi:hypothetical protein